MLAVLLLAACTKSELTEDAPEVGGDSTVVKTKKFKFTVKGDFTRDMGTRADYLSADGKSMTDLWVFDYMGGALVQQLHQSSTDDDWGQPTMNLAYGSHHVYFVASRGTGATLNTTNCTLVFTKVLDAFWKDYSVDVVSTSNGNRAVTLDRVVSKLKLIFNDVIPADAATFNVIPSTWYYGINYQTGAPTSAATNQAVTITIPSSSIGKTGEYLSIYGFSGTTEWTTDVTVNCKDGNSAVLGSATIEDIPFVRNRASEYTGNLFSSGGGLSPTLNAEWTASYTGTW